jgi:hypothetical protein
MNMEKSCQQKNSDSSKKFVRKPLIAIRRGPVLYTPKNTLSRGPAASPDDCAHARGTGCAASEGGSVRGSARDEPARLRFTSLRPPPAAAPP